MTAVDVLLMAVGVDYCGFIVECRWLIYVEVVVVLVVVVVVVVICC